MKTLLYPVLLIVALGTVTYGIYVRAADSSNFQTFEYATIKWDGREDTHLIRPSGRVEMLGPLLMKAKRPDRSDERSFYMNVAVNALAKEGYELAGMTGDEIVMKR